MTKKKGLGAAQGAWIHMQEHLADAQLGRARKEAYDFMVSVLHRLEDGGSLWQVGFWAARAGVGNSLRALARCYPETAHGLAMGERLRKLVVQMQKREDELANEAEADDKEDPK